MPIYDQSPDSLKGDFFDVIRCLKALPDDGVRRACMKDIQNTFDAVLLEAKSFHLASSTGVITAVPQGAPGKSRIKAGYKQSVGSKGKGKRKRRSRLPVSEDKCSKRPPAQLDTYSTGSPGTLPTYGSGSFK